MYSGIFIPIEPVKSSIDKVTPVLNRVNKWNYIPSPSCIRDTFDVSGSTATEIHKQLLELKGIPISNFKRKKIVKERSTLRRFLEFQLEAIPRITRAIKYMFPSRG